MKIKFTMQAPEGDRFAPTAFDRQIGKVLPVLAEVGVSQGTLLEAHVAADGASAELTVEGDLRLPVGPPLRATDFSLRTPDTLSSESLAVFDEFRSGRMEDT